MKSRIARFTIVALASMAWFLIVNPVAAQSVTGRLIGTVQDSSDAAVPDAQITITNQDTGLVLKLASDSRGNYIAPALPLGPYKIQVETAGFRTATSSGNVITVAQTLRVDFTMQVGTVSESVEVTAAAAMVESTTSELGQTITQREIQTLPLNGRIFSQLVALSPGGHRHGTGRSGREFFRSGRAHVHHDQRERSAVVRDQLRAGRSQQ